MLRKFIFILGFLLASVANGQGQNTTVSQDASVRPVPDPTTLTTAALKEAIAAQRELFDSKIRALQEEFDRQKKNAEGLEARTVYRLDSVPSVIETAVVHLQRLTEEKFKGVDQQFQGRDVALAAALLAQKTSVDEQNKANAASSAKAEGATTKQIDNIQLIIQANSKGTDDKIDGVKTLLASQAKSVDDKITDLRNMINTLQSLNTTLVARGAGQNDLYGYLIGAGGLLIAFLAFVMPRMTMAHAEQQPRYYQSRPPAPQVSVAPVVPVPVNNSNQQ